MGSVPDPTATPVAIPARAPVALPERKASSIAETAAPDAKSSLPELRTVSPPAAGLVRAPERLVQHPSAPDPVARGTPKPEPEKANNANFQVAANSSKETQPKGTETWANSVATQGDDLKSTPAEARRLPRGYITVESKPESLSEPAIRNRPSKPPEHQPRTQDFPLESHDNYPKPQEILSKRGDIPAKPVDESDGL
ncbi:MAG: hypothetical protein JOZ60_11125, partial [Verrucomicrobia bacterium]|nr:hypothetical protein [Verrucomicrobiota bacterium]